MLDPNGGAEGGPDLCSVVERHHRATPGAAAPASVASAGVARWCLGKLSWGSSRERGSAYRHEVLGF